VLVSVSQRSAGDSAGRGQTLAIFALFLVVLLGISAVAVDYGTWLLSKRNYQNISDAAALNGVALLTRPVADQCTVGKTKAVCAREAAWTSVKEQLNLPGLVVATQGAANTAQASPYTEAGYSIWVDTPPNAAGTKYPGTYADNNHIFVRVERINQTFFGRILGQADPVVTAWSTAGLLANRFAVVALCPKSAHTSDCPQAQDIKIAGNNTSVQVVDGDVGSNWGFTVTSGTAPGLLLPGDSHAYFIDYNTCSNSTWRCPPATLGGIQDGGSPASSKPAQQLVVPATDPAYPLPTWIDDHTTAVPDQPDFNGNSAGNPVNPTQGNVSCDVTSTHLPPGTYDKIIVKKGCVVLDATKDLKAGQRPGVFRIKTKFDLGNDAFIIADGVSIFFDSTVSFSVGNGAGLVVNNDNVAPNHRLGAWTTAGFAPWSVCGTDGCVPTYSTNIDGIGMAFYIRPRSDGNPTTIFNMSTGGNTSGLAFRGALYGPKDAVGIGGNNGQSSAGIIVAWTITYNGTTTLTQIYEGPADERPFLVEPTLGQ